MPEYRVVHLDFKGATPSISYLKEIFPLLKKSGANTLLIEYEDTFPYWGKIVNASALNAFTVKQIQELLNAAKVHQLEVIPLVQTFGHMEHVLKLEEFQSLREVPNNPISICPTKDEAFPLVKEMIDQLMNLHQGHIKFLHIGKFHKVLESVFYHHPKSFKVTLVSYRSRVGILFQPQKYQSNISFLKFQSPYFITNPNLL